jgi:competence protein ComEA
MLERLHAFLDRLSALPYWQAALLAVLLAVAALGGYLILRPPPRPLVEFQPAGESGEEDAASQQQGLTVHVSGAVRYPGVVLLVEGERVIDAVEAAGGPLPEADLEALNLAQAVQDGQKISVPVRGGDSAVAASMNEESGRINLNTASRRELEELPGIGPTLAERIVTYRERKGGFRSVEELKQVSGIGPKKFEEIRDLVEI